MEKIRIIICDDHPLIAEGLQSLIAQKTDMEIISTAATAAELMHILENHETDIILLDVNLPDANGIDVCLDIKKK